MGIRETMPHEYGHQVTFRQAAVRNNVLLTDENDSLKIADRIGHASCCHRISVMGSTGMYVLHTTHVAGLKASIAHTGQTFSKSPYLSCSICLYACPSVCSSSDEGMIDQNDEVSVAEYERLSGL